MYNNYNTCIIVSLLSLSNHATSCEVRQKTNKMHQLDVYYQYFLNMFRASLTSRFAHDARSQKPKTFISLTRSLFPQNLLCYLLYVIFT